MARASAGVAVCALLSLLFLAGVVCTEVQESTPQGVAPLAKSEELTYHQDDHDYKHEYDGHKDDRKKDGHDLKGKGDEEYKDDDKEYYYYKEESVEDDGKYYSKYNDGDKDEVSDDTEDDGYGYFTVLDIKEYETKKALDAKLLQVALNLEFLEAEFFLHAAKGYGLDEFAPELVNGGPKPIGGQKACLYKLTHDIIWQFALQEVGHLRAIKKTLGKYYFGRPELDISKKVFADLIDKAFGKKLEPSFDVYASPIHFFIGVYVIPYVGLTGYVGANPDLLTPRFRRVVAGLLGVEAGQDAVTRQYLYERKHKLVEPYGIPVKEFTAKISKLRNKLSRDGILDEGLVVPKFLGPEKRWPGNILAANKHSLSYARKPWQVLSTVYGTGNASEPGGFFPRGAKGKIANFYLKRQEPEEGKKEPEGKKKRERKEKKEPEGKEKKEPEGKEKKEPEGKEKKEPEGKEKKEPEGKEKEEPEGKEKEEPEGKEKKEPEGKKKEPEEEKKEPEGKEDGHDGDATKDDGYGHPWKKDDGHEHDGDGKKDDGYGHPWKKDDGEKDGKKSEEVQT